MESLEVTHALEANTEEIIADEYEERDGFRIPVALLPAVDNGPLLPEDANLMSSVFKTADEFYHGFATLVWSNSDPDFKATPDDEQAIKAIEGWFARIAAREDTKDS